MSWLLSKWRFVRPWLCRGRIIADIEWRSGGHWRPVADGLAYVECLLHAEHEAGDHFIAVGEVKDFSLVNGDASPLLYFRSGFGVFGGM